MTERQYLPRGLFCCCVTGLFTVLGCNAMLGLEETKLRQDAAVGGAGGAEEAGVGGAGGQTTDGGGGTAGKAGGGGSGGTAGSAGTAGAAGLGGSAGIAGSAGAGGDAGAGGGSCVSETEEEFCLHLKAECDSVTDLDNCGVSRTVNCGTCQGIQICGGEDAPHKCGSPVYVCVAESGSDANPGSSTSPKATIAGALGVVASGGTIRIAAGTYHASAEIMLTKEASLRGGYSNDFSSRSLSSPSIVEADTAGSLVSVFGTGNSSTLEGLTLHPKAASGKPGKAIVISSGCPIIRSNTITLSGIAGAVTYGVYIEDQSDCPALIHSNFIGCTNCTSVRGVESHTTANPLIYNNTIRAGNDGAAVVASGSNARMVNNIFFSSVASGYCVRGYGSGHPSELRNNLFFDCVYYGRDGHTDLTTIAAVNDKSQTGITGADSGNIDAPGLAAVKFVSATDWHLTSNTPQEIRQGGVDILTAVPADRDGEPRSVPLSIGADEVD